MMRRIKPDKLLWILGVLLPLALVGGVMSGPLPISFAGVINGVAQLFNGAIEHTQEAVVVSAIRLPRALLAGLMGACLAVCGAVLQGLFRNPLADPTLIGVSMGASAGASFVIVFGALLMPGSVYLGLPLVAFGAFSGGLLTALLVYRLATWPSGTSVSTMLLAGIAISALAGALNSLFSYLADNDMLRQISLWQMGNLGSADWSRVGIGAAMVACLMTVFPRDSRALNAMLLGESEARHLGIQVEKMKRRLIFWVALGIGIAVAIAGTIAFVGLIIPHLVRMLIGPDHRYLVPASALAGAVLLIAADTAARIVIAPAELPTGILTALLGAPFFVSLLIQQRKLRGR